MNRLMVDLETLGTGYNSVIVSIGIVRFDSDTVTDRFYRRISLESCIQVGLDINAHTILWWMERPDEVRSELYKPSVPIREGLEELSEWMQKNGEVEELWGNGAAFDNVILKNAFDKCSMNLPWHFSKDRCYRTMKALYPSIKSPIQNLMEHNALYDAETQAHHLIQILKECT